MKRKLKKVLMILLCNVLLAQTVATGLLYSNGYATEVVEETAAEETTEAEKGDNKTEAVEEQTEQAETEAEKAKETVNSGDVKTETAESEAETEKSEDSEETEKAEEKENIENSEEAKTEEVKSDEKSDDEKVEENTDEEEETETDEKTEDEKVEEKTEKTEDAKKTDKEDKNSEVKKDKKTEDTLEDEDSEDEELEDEELENEEDLEAVLGSSSFDVRDISFSATDIISGRTFNFNGNNGRPAVILFGGLSSCYYSKSAIKTINEIVSRTDTSKYDIYVIDIKKNAESSIRNEASSSNWYSGFHVASLGSYGTQMYSLYSKCTSSFVEQGSSWTMPLIAYKGADGILATGTTGPVSSSDIVKKMKSIGINVVSNDKYETYLVKYDQQNARSMFNMINSFRTSSEAWYWNSDNRTKTYKTGLRTLAYDKRLEAVAMLRAAELAKLYSHTRPNGDSCFSAHELIDYRYSAAGENIAYCYGYGDDTAALIFSLWKEDDQDYDGQGHRRNMLGDQFTAVGIGHCVYNGVHFWVQEFANPVSSSNQSYSNLGDSLLYDSAYVKIYTAGTGEFSIAKKYEPGWRRDGDKWWYQNADGTYPKNAWKTIEGKWYYFNASGYMQTGWLYYNGDWYFFDSSGNMQTGWISDAGKWYYLDANGVMATSRWIADTYYVKSNGVMAVNEWINGKYYVGADGKWVPGKQMPGWKQDKTGWWYLNADGTCPRSCWKEIGGQWYHFNASGYMQTGWILDGKVWYYLQSNGAMAVNKWIQDKYFVKANGAMAVSEWVDGGKYYVDSNGVWVPGKTR